MAVKPQAKVALLVIAGVTLFGGLRYGASHGLLPSNLGRVIAPKHYDLPPVEDAKVANVAPAPYPSTTPSSIGGVPIRGEIWEWNAQAGMILANGGNKTTKGSLMEKHKVNLTLTRQDDTNQMVTDLVDCAKQIKGGSTSCTNGANFIVIMGDQAAEVAASANKLLRKIGPDYGLNLIGAIGYSRGEDACMTPASYRDDPKSIAQTKMFTADGTELPVHGLAIAMSPVEGDWNICLKHAGDNAVPNNPDPSTFDADAINIFVEPDYNTAAADYVAGKCEKRKEIKTDKATGKSKLTGNEVTICVNGVATWTPGDVTVATKRGGLVKAADSLMYSSQMPSVIIGPAKFINDNKEAFKGLLKASWEGADQIKAYDAALHKAAEIEAKVYNDEGDAGSKHGDYWYHYFHPVKQKDATGLQVSLGGSMVANFADNVILFGLHDSNNNMASSFNIFREIDLQQYPQRFKADGETPLPLAKEVINSKLIAEIDQEVRDGGDIADAGAAADKADYSGGSGAVVSHRSYSINFATGSAQPLPDGEATLRQLLDSIAITGLKVKVDGYTDSTGSAAVNTALSAARAQEVRTWLQTKARKNFPDNRFVSVEGHGSANPVGDNAANRRVEISLIN